MSADNGIYIATFYVPHKDNPTLFIREYRVIHAQGIDNLDEAKKLSDKDYLIEIKNYFEASKVFATLDDAFEEAKQLLIEKSYVEYGVVNLGVLPYWEAIENPLWQVTLRFKLDRNDYPDPVEWDWATLLDLDGEITSVASKKLN